MNKEISDKQRHLIKVENFRYLIDKYQSFQHDKDNEKQNNIIDQF